MTSGIARPKARKHLHTGSTQSTGARPIDDAHAAIAIRITRTGSDLILLVTEFRAHRDLQLVPQANVELIGQIEIGCRLIEREPARVKTFRAERTERDVVGLGHRIRKLVTAIDRAEI